MKPALMIELARLAVETRLWPLLEYENGELTGVKKVRRPKPTEEYLKLQGRYKHLFKKARMCGYAGPDPGHGGCEYRQVQAG